METPANEALQRRTNFILATGNEPTEIRGSREILIRLTNEVIDGDSNPDYRGQMLERFYGMVVIEDNDLIGLLVL